MGIFSRFADIVNSNISALLDKAEDPEKMIRLIIQEMEDTLVEVRTNSAKAIADKKELARKVEAIEDQINEWGKKASLALVKEREDLARAALIEKQKLEQLIKGLHTEQTLVEETIDKLTGEIGKLENKIAETRAKQQALAIRNQTATNRRDVQKHLHTSRTNEAMAKFEQYSRKVDELEAEADLYSSTGQSKSLEQEFAELQAQDEIEKELAKLKEQMSSQDK
ncbi:MULTISPECIES: phage shock protein PspA [Vibrio]|jgi:phage shock protein A|uniref:Phage shock protein PspA n=1 Tax=Vibrio natriegens NBRC 15636 = ATCC 14048 = DSM 759 TaxID=1219067 RepID=A0AAN0Y258_VIBNA|nr:MULTISPECIES: phage shock protein PspA [Vibrio]MEE3878230.1 phage shock protein PspA [Vibrio sp. YYF0003]WMN88331.1 phage shock protein PspA [Vibrio parahaemolyticus]CAH0529394.1 Phage shock protein A [Catenococcus thiocycli]ALR15868.1 phage-shock protein [Vibrio natriegens NBRC 15636 = ATCC 14048 = DSM 759]ANQ12273.1 phage shock protein PspA [Vibrio natriegens NBRC 15636 = ATCC 14048 = DSM 759]